MANTIKNLDPQNITADLPIAGPVQKVPLTPMDMLARAVASGADIDVLEKLMGLQERWQASQSRIEFENAMAEAKREIPVIIKDTKGHTGKYASLAAITKVIDPILSKHGLQFRFRTTQTDRITVTCIIFGHGHTEENSLSGPPDKGPGRNDLQAIGSTQTYLSRYTLLGALGIATANDDDGNSGGMGATITEKQADDIVDLAAEVNADMDVLCKILKVEFINQLPERQYASAIALLKAKRAQNKGA